jgi:hypothetical protein
MDGQLLLSPCAAQRNRCTDDFQPIEFCAERDLRQGSLDTNLHQVELRLHFSNTGDSVIVALRRVPREKTRTLETEGCGTQPPKPCLWRMLYLRLETQAARYAPPVRGREAAKNRQLAQGYNDNPP